MKNKVVKRVCPKRKRMKRPTIRNRMSRSKTLYAGRLRKNPTPSEKLMWESILCRRKTGYKFIRQKTILGYIVDFYAPQLKLVIEIDGSFHDLPNQKHKDKLRDWRMRDKRITTWRISDKKVITDLPNLTVEVSEYIQKLKEEL